MRSPLLAAVLLVSLILAVLIGMVLLLRETGSSAPIDSLPRDTGFLLRATDPAKLCRDLSHTRMIPLEEDETWDAFAALLALLLERHGIDFAPSAAEMAQALRRETIVAIVPGDAEEPSG